MYKYGEVLLKSFIFFTILIFLYFLIQNIFFYDTVPLYSDEYGYYLDLKNFLLNTSISAPLTLDESYSKIGNFSFHGVGYTILYGTLALITNIDSILGINIIIAILSLIFIISIKKLDRDIKYILIGIFLTYPIFFIYTFTYMVETIHIFFSLIVTYLIYKTFQSRGKNGKYIFLLIFTIFILSFLRITWVMFLIPLLFLPERRDKNNKSKKAIFYLFLIIFIGLIGVLNIYLFYAPYPNSFLNILFQEPLSSWIDLIFKHLLGNLNQFFMRHDSLLYLSLKVLFLLTTIYSLSIGLIRRNRFILSISVVSILYFAFLMLFYDAFGWREHRVLAVVYSSLLFALFLERERRFLIFIFLIQFINLFSLIELYVKDRGNYYKKYKSDDSSLTSLYKKEIFNLQSSSKNKKILIAVDNNFWNLNFNKIFIKIPLKTVNGTVVSYSPYYFKFFNQESTKANYLITGRIIENLNLVVNNNKFKIYSISEVKNGED